uniref:Aluminum-activated malate transporter family protein n=3 Tax=Glycine subgen. Soja TaxID=1462606 RepID=K7MLU1_SOYBN
MVTGNLMKRVLALGDKLRVFLSLAWESVWKMGRDDPRRVIYAFKVGFSLTLVSLLYLLEPFFKGLGENVIWAVMTVVVVFQFTAGATLCKGLNRGFGTLSAGLLAFLIKYFSSGCGHVFHALVIGATVFIIGASSSYMRFFPCIKKNYDYGVNIFLLTYNLVAVSGYRIDNVFKMAHERFSNIAIGVAICLLMSLLVFPNWSGEALHNSTASKLEGLAKSLEACVNEYFYGEMETSGDKKSSEDIYEGYKAVLDSKSTDETQALHASWEPRHLCRKFPWQQYVKVGTVIRQFGYTVVSLHGCLKTEIQTPQFVRVLFKNHCTRLAKEVSKVLIELANSIRNRRHCSQEILSDNLKEALLDLNTAIKSQPRLFLGSNDYQDNNMPVIPGSQEAGKKTNDANGVKTDSLALQECKTKRACTEQEPPKELAERKVLIRPQLTKIVITSLEFSEALPFAAFASLLVETVVKLDSVIEEVEELGRLACFKEYITDDKIIVSFGHLWMAYCIPNSPSLQGWKTGPCCLFGWNIGKNRVNGKPQIKYHDIDLTFPTSLVDKTFLRGKELKCCYRATIDGFSATNFHECCDFKGPCVIIGYTNKSFKFGAFNPEGYRSTDDYYDTFDAFLFYWIDNETTKPIMLPKVGGSGAALFDYARGGPQFGADGLLIGPPLAPVMGGFAGPDTNSGIGDLRQAKSRLGLSYAKREDGKESIFGDESRATLEEVEVFCSPQIASLY